MKSTIRYPEAIGLTLVIAAVLGSWVSTVLKRATDPEVTCALRPNPGGVDASLWNVHCMHVAESRALDRPTQLAGHGRTIPEGAFSRKAEAGFPEKMRPDEESTALGAGAELSAVIGHPSDGRDCVMPASPAGSMTHLSSTRYARQ